MKGELMNAVLLSVRPQWCAKIANREKTLEIRKNRPKLETPFKCYIYCTVGGDALCPPHANCSQWDIHRQNNGTTNGRKITMAERNNNDFRFVNGKVIGEFVCDEIKKHNYDNFIGAVNTDGSERTEAIQGEGTYWIWEDERKETCLSQNEILEYGGTKPLYGWHISALQIYDKPRELSEFTPMCRYLEDDGCCQHRKVSCGFQDADYNQDDSLNLVECGRKMTRPPQSWCYVEPISKDEALGDLQ